MLKSLINSICYYLGIFLSLIYTYNFHRKLKWIRFKIFSSWISKSFKSFGKNSIIQGNLHLVGGQYIKIGHGTSIGTRAVLTAWDNHTSDFKPVISIGNNVCIGDDCHITSANCVNIGDNILMGKKITITDNSHGESDLTSILISPVERKIYSSGPVNIEAGVWIGDKVTILSNVRIGKNSIIGSNAVVTKDIPANCVVGGVPAKIIKLIQ